MKKAIESRCAICLERRADKDGWFLLTENRWTDRVKILGWTEALAGQPGVHAACSSEHVQHLVIHWMATGSLDYPFARANTGEKGNRKRTLPPIASPAEPDTRGLRILGELAVHRESLERVLNDNPESLVTILTGLVSSLGPRPVPTSAEEENEEEFAYALT